MTSKSRFAREAMSWSRAGKNVLAEARGRIGTEVTLQDAIEIAYDLQAGSYTAIVSQPERRPAQLAWGTRLAGILDELGVRTACEAGIGEASTLAHVAAAAPKIAFSGFDISLSRVLYGRDYLRREGVSAVVFCADLLQIPLPDGAVDAVITNHSIEPNGGQEGPVLAELLRVAARYLVLIEPDFERGSAEQQQRMTQHNYVRDLPRHLAALPGRMLRYEPWPYHPNPLNKASLIVFEKQDPQPAPAELTFCAPITKQRLVPLDGYFYCAEEGLLYPMPFGIPVLRDNCAIVCTQAERFGPTKVGN